MKDTNTKRFSLIARIRSANHALRGLSLLFRTTHNFWVQIFFAILVLFFGFILKISNIEWVLVVFAIGLVFVSEAFNTAIEIDIDLTSPEYHPYAKDTKDVSAGAVLISVFVALIVGIIIFLPKIFAIF